MVINLLCIITVRRGFFNMATRHEKFFNQNGFLLRQIYLSLLRLHILSSPVADEFSPFIRLLTMS